MANTPNMNLALPTVSVTAGPAWASQLNTVLAAIDAHNHTSGSGVPVPSAGLNINAALPFNGNDATTLRTTRFSDQTNPLTAPSDVGCLYLAGGNLFFNSGAGAAVQITAGAALAGTPGSIGGLVSPAAVTYTPASTSFRFTSNTNVNAQLDIAQLTIRQPIAAANGVTLQSPNALAASYSVTLPTALPAAQRIMTLDNLGAMSFWNIDATALVNNAGVLSVVGVLQYATNSSATIKGNRSAGDAGADVISTSTVLRTAGYIHQFQNNGSALASIDLNGNFVFHVSSGGIVALPSGGAITIIGNKVAADAGADISTGSTVTRTAGYLHQFTNLAATKAAVGFDGQVHAPNASRTARVTAQQSTTSTTLGNVTGMVVPAAWSSATQPLYALEFFLNTQGPNGINLNIGWSLGTGLNLTGLLSFMNSSTVAALSALNIINAATFTSAFGTSGTFFIHFTGYIFSSTASGTGNVQMQFSSGTAGQTVSINPGSWMRWTKVDGTFD